MFGGGAVTADSYWNVQTTGQTNGGGAPASNGLTTAQMSNPASFAGWDFGPNGAWAMPAGLIPCCGGNCRPTAYLRSKSHLTRYRRL